MLQPEDRINRQDRPPAVTRVIRIRPVGAHDHFSGTVLSESLFGFWTHWNGVKTVPCWEGQAHCPGCDCQEPKRWKGLIELWEGGNTVPYFVDLTPLAAKEFLDRLDKEQLRGVRVSIARERRHARAPLRVTILDRHFGQLPRPHDPMPTLKVLWTFKP